MFEVSWTDPERETVGERKNRKQQRSACSPRNGPRVPSQPSGKPASRNVFSPNPRKSALSRAKQSRSSSTLRVNSTTAARKQSTCSCTTSSDSSFQETPRTSTTTLPESSFFSDSYHSDDENSEGLSSVPTSLPLLPSRSTELTAVVSSTTNSTWSLGATSTTSTGKIIQQLSPTSFVTQSTEITVSPREMVKDAEQVAIRVHISASGALHVNDSPSRRSGSSFPLHVFMLTL
jgi:hypothetical protein